MGKVIDHSSCTPYILLKAARCVVSAGWVTKPRKMPLNFSRAGRRFPAIRTGRAFAAPAGSAPLYGSTDNMITMGLDLHVIYTSRPPDDRANTRTVR